VATSRCWRTRARASAATGRCSGRGALRCPSRTRAGRSRRGRRRPTPFTRSCAGCTA
ncbi:unnamed protein product, partial [Prorocentrum cordatum]